MKITRRDLIKFFLAYTFSHNAIAIADKSNPAECFLSRQDINPELKEECIAVFHAWNSSVTDITPVQYLSKLQIYQPDGVNNLNRIITDDFKNQNNIVVNGLVLSKTEASIIACIGESLL